MSNSHSDLLPAGVISSGFSGGWNGCIPWGVDRQGLAPSLKPWSPVFFIIWHFYCCDKTSQTKINLGMKRQIYSVFISTAQSVPEGREGGTLNMAGTSSQELLQRPPQNEEWCFLACFQDHQGWHLSWWAAPHLHPPQQLSIKKIYHSLAHGQIWWGIVSVEVPFSQMTCIIKLLNKEW